MNKVCADLADQIESLSCGDVNLNKLVYAAYFPVSDPNSGYVISQRIAPYTTDYIVAKGLIPRGWSMKAIVHPEICYVELYKLAETITKNTNGTLERKVVEGQNGEYDGAAKTLGLAICAAALRIPVDKRAINT